MFEHKLKNADPPTQSGEETTAWSDNMIADVKMFACG